MLAFALVFLTRAVTPKVTSHLGESEKASFLEARAPVGSTPLSGQADADAVWVPEVVQAAGSATKSAAGSVASGASSAGSAVGHAAEESAGFAYNKTKEGAVATRDTAASAGRSAYDTAAHAGHDVAVAGRATAAGAKEVGGEAGSKAYKASGSVGEAAYGAGKFTSDGIASAATTTYDSAAHVGTYTKQKASDALDAAADSTGMVGQQTRLAVETAAAKARSLGQSAPVARARAADEIAQDALDDVKQAWGQTAHYAEGSVHMAGSITGISNTIKGIYPQKAAEPEKEAKADAAVVLGLCALALF